MRCTKGEEGASWRLRLTATGAVRTSAAAESGLRGPDSPCSTWPSSEEIAFSWWNGSGKVRRWVFRRFAVSCYGCTIVAITIFLLSKEIVSGGE